VPRSLPLLLILSGVLPLCGEALAADTGKLRYVTAIYLDDKGTGMRQPEGVACNDKATVIVGDTGRGRLLRYTIEDGAVKPAGEILAPQVAAPIRVQLTSRGDILALDGKERRVARFDAKGEFKGYLRPEGVPEPTSIVPRSVKVDRNDRIHLLDVFSARVLVLDADGKYLRHVPFPRDHGFFSDLAVDGRGTIYLLDSVRAAVHAAGKDAKEFSLIAKDLRPHLSFPTSIAVDTRGVLYLVDQNGGAIVLVGQDGAFLGRQLAMGWNEGLLYYPSQMCVNDKGQIFIADRGNSRVQVFSIVR
jgi:sugar lactone lactonase YvrE